VGTLPDGRVVFVPRTAPGDLVELRSVTTAKRFARARIARVVEPSAVRVEPPCPHYRFDDCGGCQLQHLATTAQREARRQIVVDAMRRIGGQELDPPPLEPSEAEWGYRTKISLSVGGSRRSVPGPIGYHRVGRADQVFDLTRCPIARPELTKVWDAVRPSRALLPSNASRVILRIDRSANRHLIVRTSGSGTWTRARELGESLVRDGAAATLWWHPEDGAPRVLYGQTETFPATVFEQVHPAMGDRVRAYAVTRLGELDRRHVWDLYAGIGETTLRIVGLSSSVTVDSVELDGRAVRLADQRGPQERVTRHAGRVEDLITRLRPAHAVILNPPRTGLHADVINALMVPSRRAAEPSNRAAEPPSRIVYVSCDPATLARDIARLASRYRLVDVRAFDLFPQTAHVETVATLERA
jgi:23S rRNA (uracil1939-C5)-methyltransferase